MLFGDENGKSTGEAATKFAKKRSAKEALLNGGDGTEKVKRKRVKLKDLARREIGKETGSKEAQKTDRAAKAKAPAAVATDPLQQKIALGRMKAAGILDQGSRLSQCSVKYNSAKKDAESVLTKTGQQRWLLNNLISMTSLCVEQHTGGKAGEAYDSRRDNRLIYMALRGMRDSGSKSEGVPSAAKMITRGEYESRRSKAREIFTSILSPPFAPPICPNITKSRKPGAGRSELNGQKALMRHIFLRAAVVCLLTAASAQAQPGSGTPYRYPRDFAQRLFTKEDMLLLSVLMALPPTPRLPPYLNPALFHFRISTLPLTRPTIRLKPKTPGKCPLSPILTPRRPPTRPRR